MSAHDTLLQFGFEESRYRQFCSDRGVDSDRISRVLTTMLKEPEQPPMDMWNMINAFGDSGALTKQIASESTTFTEFCGRMTTDTICPANYYAAFWQIARGLLGMPVG